MRSSGGPPTGRDAGDSKNAYLEEGLGNSRECDKGPLRYTPSCWPRRGESDGLSFHVIVFRFRQISFSAPSPSIQAADVGEGRGSISRTRSNAGRFK